MMTRAGHVLSMALVAIVAAGCGRTAQSRFYTLDAVATAEGAPSTSLAVIVGPVSVPASVDRPEFVVPVAANRVEIDEFNRWAAPLGDAIARTVAGNLTVLLGSPRVVTAPLANFDANYRVTIDVQRFESVPGEAVVFDAVWAVRGSKGATGRSGRTTARETVPDASYDALAAAYSRALATMSGDIAAAIRTTATGKR